jgi:hypothetical protein
MSVSDSAKTVTQVVQAFLWSLFALLLVSFMFSQAARKHVARIAKEANLKSISEKGLEFVTVEEKSVQLVKENNELKMKQNPPPRNQDLRPDAAATALLDALKEVKPESAPKGESWVYVGEYSEQKASFRNPPNFNVVKPPEPNMIITASQAVYERDAKPHQDQQKNWQLGSIEGVLSKGKSVEVVEVARIEGENAQDFNSWIKIRPE